MRQPQVGHVGERARPATAGRPLRRLRPSAGRRSPPAAGESPRAGRRCGRGSCKRTCSPRSAFDPSGAGRTSRRLRRSASRRNTTSRPRSAAATACGEGAEGLHQPHARGAPVAEAAPPRPPGGPRASKASPASTCPPTVLSQRPAFSLSAGRRCRRSALRALDQQDVDRADGEAGALGLVRRRDPRSRGPRRRRRSAISPCGSATVLGPVSSATASAAGARRRRSAHRTG